MTQDDQVLALLGELREWKGEMSARMDGLERSIEAVHKDVLQDLERGRQRMDKHENAIQRIDNNQQAIADQDRRLTQLEQAQENKRDRVVQAVVAAAAVGALVVSIWPRG